MSSWGILLGEIGKLVDTEYLLLSPSALHSPVPSEPQFKLQPELPVFKYHLIRTRKEKKHQETVRPFTSLASHSDVNSRSLRWEGKWITENIRSLSDFTPPLGPVNLLFNEPVSKIDSNDVISIIKVECFQFLLCLLLIWGKAEDLQWHKP